MVDAQQRANQAISGIATALTDISQELHNVQQQLQYWKLEADAWKARYEQERGRSERLRRVLRCTPVNPTGRGLTAQPSLTSTPKGLRALGSGCISFSSTTGAGAGSAAAAAAAAAQQATGNRVLQQSLTWGSNAGRRGSNGSNRSRSPPLSPGQRQQQQQQQQQPAGWSNSSSGSESPTWRQQQQQQQQFVPALQQQQQQLKPLKCVPEGGSSHSSSSDLLQLQQPAAGTSSSSPPQAAGSSMSAHHSPTKATRVNKGSSSNSAPASASAADAAAAMAGAPAGCDSPSADPFAHYHTLCTVSDSGEPCDSLQVGYQQQQDGNNSSSSSRGRSTTSTSTGLQLQERSGTAGLAPNAAAGDDSSTADGAAGGGLSNAADKPAFRRARTMPSNSSFAAALQAPSFSGGGGGGGGAFLHPTASWFAPGGSQSFMGQQPQSRHTVDQLLSVMMAFTLMQGAAEQDGMQNGEGPDEDVLPSVSLDDDDGSSGVGLAAAAAVSAAMARAWASAASREQRAVAAAAGGGGSGSGGNKTGGAREPGSSSKAGFRLVATVTNKMGKRQASASALSSIGSQDSLDSSSTADLPALLKDKQDPVKPPGLPISKHSSSSSLTRTASGSAAAAAGAGGGAGGDTSAASAAAAAAAVAVADTGNTVRFNSSGSGGSPQRSLPPAAAAAGAPTASGAAKSAAAASASSAAPNTSQATTISLQWLSRPRTVLVMRKLAPSTEAAFLRALDWLRRHQVTIFVEPKVYQELVEAGRVLPIPAAGAAAGAAGAGQSQQTSNNAAATDSSSSGSSSSGSLTGMLVSSALTAPSLPPAQAGLFPANSWAGPTTGTISSTSDAAAVALPSAGGGGAAALGSGSGSGTAAAAAVGAGGAAAGVVKTWQPDLHVDQQQQQQQTGDSSSSAAMVKTSDLIPESVAQQLDLVVVLGGDGTVLWTCHIFGNRSVPPLVPFNLGSLGFLTPFDPARLEQVLLKTFRGGFPITLRHRLHCTIVRCSTICPAPTAAAAGGGGSGDSSSSSGGAALATTDGDLPSVSKGCVGYCVYGEEHVSLNEVVIERGISPFLTNLECFCDGTFVTHVQGDGLIVGTPTGSTAYSLAAGGSMVHPQVPCILFTPICPHSLSFRPLMFPDYVQLCVQVPADARGHVWASFDGKDRTELGPGDAVVIRLSKWPVPSVAAEADPSSDWFSAVRECLHWNLRKVQGGAGM